MQKRRLRNQLNGQYALLNKSSGRLTSNYYPTRNVNSCLKLNRIAGLYALTDIICADGMVNEPIPLIHYAYQKVGRR